MQEYLFYYRNMNIGGCQLLILNFCNELLAKGYRVGILCEFADNKILEASKNIELIVTGKDKWYSDNYIQEKIHSFSNANITTFIWDDYIRVYSLKGNNQKLIFYAVHCDILKYATYSKNILIRAIRKSFLKTTIINLVEKNNLIVMDKQTIKHSEEYYKCNLNDAYIIHIPVNNSDLSINLDDINQKLYNSQKNILAIARADFPFKGYLLGLIDALSSNVIPEDYSITIVSYGQDIDKLKKAIDSLDSAKRKRVTLYGETPYSDLRNLFNRSNIYVGMGTTLLDASKYGVVSIPVAAYTNQLICNDFFHNDPEWVAVENGSDSSFIKLIKNYESMSIEEKKAISLKCIDIVNTLYNIENSVNRLIYVFENINLYYDKRIITSYKLRKIKRNIQYKWGMLK